MKLRVFTFRLDPSAGTFNDTELVAFLHEREALAVSEHFFTFDGTPTLALLVQYREQPSISAGRRRDEPRLARAEAPAIDLAPEDQALFEALRKWRNERARRDGRPAYVLFTNAQLAAVAAHRPATREALQSIEGVGEARVRDYADDVLALVGAVPAKAEAPDADDARPT